MVEGKKEMKRTLKWICVMCFVVSVFALGQCLPSPSSTEEPTAAPTSPLPTEEPAAALTSPLATEEPTPVPPTPIPPTEEPEITLGWTSHASTGTELSFEHPGEWFGPAELANRDGVYVKDPGAEMGMFMRWWLSGSPAELLAAWGTEDIAVLGVVDIPVEEVTAGDPVTVSRMDAPTRIAQGGDMTAQATFVRRPEDVLELVWFAPTERWDDMQETFSALLASIEVWHKHSDREYGLQTMYLHDWAEPTAPWEGEGLWFHSADEGTGLVIWTRPLGDPLELLADWSPDAISGLGFSDCTMAMAEERDRLSAVGGQWESKTGQCTGPSGAQMTYVATYALNRDRSLEIAVYAPSDQWEHAKRISSTMLSLLGDIR